MKHIVDPRHLDKLCLHLGDDLNAEHCAKIKAEVENCPTCTMILDEISGTIEIYRRALAPAKLPEATMLRLKQRLNLGG
jgi:predicted dithiol-disulfide oxidoreductase (DUF899 family)